jgi:hypothetical protein
MRPVSGSLAGLATPMQAKQQGWRREWHGFALALLAGALLLTLGVKNTGLAIGFFCGLSGLTLLLRPRIKKLGRWLDTCLLLALILPWLALLPASWLPFLSWREAAIEAVALPLGYTLALSPLRVFEVWLLLVAAIAWLYFIRSRPLDAKTRPILCMTIAWLGGIWASWFLFIRLQHQVTNELAGMQLLGNTTLTALVFAACALMAYGIALDGVRHKQTTRLTALMPLLVISVSLVILQSTIAFIALAAGILVWTLCRLINSKEARLPRVFLFACSLFVIHGVFALQGLQEALNENDPLLSGSSLAAFALGESPLIGLGAGQSASWSVFKSQLSDDFNSKNLAFWTEFGWLGAALGIALIFGFVRKLGTRGVHIESGYRLLAFLAALICMLGVVLTDGHKNPVLLFLIASLTVLSMGHGKRFQGHFFAERPVRVAGWILLVSGCLYLFAFATALPLTHTQRLAETRAGVTSLIVKSDAHSRDLYASYLDTWVRLEPLNATPYQLRAGHTLSTIRDADIARADFQRARYLNNNGLQQLHEEAETWSLHLPAQAGEAWTAYLEQARANDTEAFAEAFASLLNHIGNNPPLELLAREYGKEHAGLRHQYIIQLQGRAFLTELEQALADGTMEHAPESALRRLATEAARRNAFNLAEQITDKMDPNNEIGRDTRLAIQFQRGQITRAVRAALDNFVPSDAPPIIDIADTAGQEDQLLRLARSNSPHRLEIAQRLLALYMETDQITRGRQLMRQLIREKSAPEFGLRWLAEILFRQGDHVESWEILRYQFPYLDILYEE